MAAHFGMCCSEPKCFWNSALLNCRFRHSPQRYRSAERDLFAGRCFWQSGQFEHIFGLQASHSQVFNTSTSLGKALCSNASMGASHCLRFLCELRHTVQVVQFGAVHRGRQQSLHKHRRPSSFLWCHWELGKLFFGWTLPQTLHA